MQSEDLPICVACGSQYDCADAPSCCKICDDPRQFVPPVGQQWTTLAGLRRKNKNKIEQDKQDGRIWHIHTEPKVGIGQAAMLFETEQGNVLWDLIALLDEDTINFIKSRGGLAAIVISHPHFWTTYADWAKAFNCPVYLSRDDEQWLCRREDSCIKWIEGPIGTTVQPTPGVTAVKCGGHFRGSLVLHFDNMLAVSDTMMTVPSAYTPYPRPLGQTTYSFMWSIPNMIPMIPDRIHGIWTAVKDLEYTRSYGNFAGMSVGPDKNLKQRTLDSMQIQVRNMGYSDHPLLSETLD